MNLVEKNPFDNFKVGSDLYGTPVYLTSDEVRTIFEADLSSSPRLERQRDVFVFQCCVGCRVGDLLSFKKTDVIDGALQYIPHKTIAKNPKTIVIPLNETARTIAARYASSPTDKLLPFISTQKYNEAIKEICEKVKDADLVSALTGHSDGSRSFSRYRSIDDDIKKELVDMLG